MNTEQFLAIKDVIFMIDEQIKKPLDLEQLSKEIGISKYHLHHLFTSITGKSLMAYVRGRKLSLSITELLNTKLKIIDIAEEYQFKHEQSYIRSFKKNFGITPSQCRKLNCEMPIEQKIDTNHLFNVGQGMMIEPRMCIRPEFYIQGIKKEIVHEQNLIHRDTNNLAIEFENNYLPLISNPVDGHTYIGLVLYTDNPDYSNDYVSSVEVTAPNPVELPFVSYTIPGNEYAVFRYIGFHSPYDVTFVTLRELYNYIWEWKDDTDYKKLPGYHFEKMNMKMCSETYCEMDIYVPITAK